MDRVRKCMVGFAALALAWFWLAVLPAGAEGPALEISDTGARYMYDFGVWDPETLSYQGSKGWKAEENSGTITITNSGTETVAVFLVFEQKDVDGVPELTAAFTDEEGIEQTEEGWTIGTGETKDISLGLTGEAPTKKGNDVSLGSVLIYAQTLQAVVDDAPAADEDPAEEPDAPAEEEPADPEGEAKQDPEKPAEETPDDAETPAGEDPEDGEEDPVEEEGETVNPDDLPPPEDEAEEPETETGALARLPEDEPIDKGFGVDVYSVDRVSDRIAEMGLTE